MPVLLKLDARELGQWAELFRLQPQKNRQVVARTLNQVGGVMRTRVTREVARATGLTYGKVAEEISTKPATAEHPTYSLTAKGGYFSLRAFGAHQTAKGVSARPWGKRRVFPGTFIVPGLGGQVFKRTAEGRLKKLWGPAVPVELLRDRVPAVMEDELQSRLAPRLAHEISRALPRNLRTSL